MIATGQQELTANPELQKIQDRFSVKVAPPNTDVDEVVRRVLLQKKPAQVGALAATLERASGEIGRELQGSAIQHRAADDDQLVRDYPLLPVAATVLGVGHCATQTRAAGPGSCDRSSASFTRPSARWRPSRSARSSAPTFLYERQERRT